MLAGISPSEFWGLTPAEYNLIVKAYRDKQKETLYRDLRNAYYTGCFAQVEKPQEFYNKILEGLEAKPQTSEEMFNFLKNMASVTQGDVLDSHFNIPLKLTPDFDVGVFSYIYHMEVETEEVYLPDVALSLDSNLLKPVNGVYTLKPGFVKIRYNNKVYTIIMLRS